MKFFAAILVFFSLVLMLAYVMYKKNVDA